MDIKPHFLCDTGTSVASFGPCVSALSVQNFSCFFVAYCKSPLPRRHTRQPEGSTQHLVSGNSGYEVGRFELLNNLTCPSIAMGPEWAMRAYGPFRIIGSLFMRAADDAVRHHDRFDSLNPEQV